MSLTVTDCRKFDNSGWVVVPRLIVGQDVMLLRSWADELTEAEDESEQFLRYYERVADGTKMLSRVERFVGSKQFPSSFLHESAVFVKALCALFRCNPILFKDKI